MASQFIDDLADRLTNREQLSSDMLSHYIEAVESGFGVENLKAAVALHFAHYNFVRIHRTLEVTPAMEAGDDKRLWKIGDLIELAN